jgi:dTDP-4-dehydrorhamnose reductase
VRIFITGISGFFGLNAALSWAGRHEVWGSYLSHPVCLPMNRALHLNLVDVYAVNKILTDVSPDVVIHAAAMTDVDACERNPEYAQHLNVIATDSVARAAKAIGARLIYLSTDQLFDGTQEWHSESDMPAPLNIYGKTKRAGEQAVLENVPNGLVVRTNFFGWGPPHKPSLTGWALARLRNASVVRGFSDVFFSPILVNDLLDRIEALIAHPSSGLLHIAGADRLSKYGFIAELARTFSLPADIVQSIQVQDIGLTAPRPRNMSLTSTKFSRHSHIAAPAVKDGLARLRNLERTGWPVALTKLLEPGSSST